MPSGGCEEPDSVFSQGSRGATARRQSRSTALGRGTVRHCWRQGGERRRDFSGRHENHSPQSPLPRSPTSRHGRSPRFRTRRRLKKLLHLVTGPSGSGKTAFCLSQADWVHHRHNMDELSKCWCGCGDSAQLCGTGRDSRRGFRTTSCPHARISRFWMSRTASKCPVPSPRLP